MGIAAAFDKDAHRSSRLGLAQQHAVHAAAEDLASCHALNRTLAASVLLTGASTMTAGGFREGNRRFADTSLER
jgi:hypothetical protein